MSAREELRREMTHNHLYMTDERAAELIDAFAHELAERIRQDTTATGEAGDQYALQYADLIDPQSTQRHTEGDPS